MRRALLFLVALLATGIVPATVLAPAVPNSAQVIAGFTGTADSSHCLSGAGTLVSCSGGAGGVTTTGSPASGNLSAFSGATSITNTDLTGDCTTSGTVAINCTKTGGVLFGALATLNTATPATGGTGLTSYTTGDLIVATGATTLALLADDTAGKYLRAGGAGAAPAYASIAASEVTAGAFAGAAAGSMTGAFTASGLIPSGSACTNNRINIPAVNTMGICANGVQVWKATSTVATLGAPQIQAGTKFTAVGTGCTIATTTGSAASAGTFTLATGPCSVVTVTINGATGATAPLGWLCPAWDQTTKTVLIGGNSSSNTTTAVFTIPAGAGTTDVIAFGPCVGI